MVKAKITTEETTIVNEIDEIPIKLYMTKGEKGDPGNDGQDGADGADGADGFSPTVETSKTGKVTTITITDANGEHTATILDGADGQGTGDMLKATYDTNANGVVDNAEKVNSHTVEDDVPEDFFSGDATATAEDGTTVELTDALELQSAELKGDTFQQTYSGANLFNYTDTSNLNPAVTLGDDGWVTMTYDNSAGSSTVYIQYYTYALPLTINTNYNVVLEVKSVSGTGSIAPVTGHLSAQFTADWSNSFASLVNNTIYTHISTTKSDFTDATHSLRTLGVFTAGQSGSIKFRLSLLADTSVTPQTFVYQPYVGGTASPNPDYPQDIQVVAGEQTVTVSDGVEPQSYPISLGSIELCKIGTYQDYIYKSGDDWYVHKEINKSLIDGSVGTLSRSSANRFNIDQIDLGWKKQSGEILCLANSYVTVPQYSTNTAFNNGTADMEFALGLHPTSNSIRIKDSDYDDATAYQNWLSSNPISLYYVLATATDTQITDSTLIGQLEALKNATVYSGKTIFENSGNLPAILSLGYIRANVKGIVETIPTVNDATLKIQANGTDVATFTANASENVTANIGAATTSAYGVTKLSSSTSSTSTTEAATPSAVKAAYDLANGKQSPLTAGTGIDITSNTISVTNIRYGTSAPSASEGNNGDIFIVYEG